MWEALLVAVIVSSLTSVKRAHGVLNLKFVLFGIRYKTSVSFLVLELRSIFQSYSSGAFEVGEFVFHISVVTRCSEPEATATVFFA